MGSFGALKGVRIFTTPDARSAAVVSIDTISPDATEDVTR